MATPPVQCNYVGEHISRLGDKDYVCLAIAENKLSFPLLQRANIAKCAEKAASDVRWEPPLAPAPVLPIPISVYMCVCMFVCV
jgi:hypothetical protein